MINYLHDIRNKLTLISGQATILSRKYGPEDFVPIQTNIMRINELVNNAYTYLSTNDSTPPVLQTSSTNEFLMQLNVLVETLKLIFPLEIVNEVLDFKTNQDFKICHNNDLILQIMENALGNSIDANATKIYTRVLEVDSKCIIELVDNGQGRAKEQHPLQKASVIPHGIGTKIITKNMTDMNGKAEWIPRLDSSGMILRLYFPMTTTLS